MQPVILWFRRNLRLADNSALLAAVESGQPVIPVYISDTQDSGTASRWWLHHSLLSLDRELRKRGASLVLRSGSPPAVLDELSRECDASAVYFARRYEPESRRQEDGVEDRLGGRLELHCYEDSLLHIPESISTQAGNPYRVFTPFWNTARSLGEPDPPSPAPHDLNVANPLPESLSLDDLGLLSGTSGQYPGYEESWTPGEPGGLDRIDDLEAILADYVVSRDRPDRDATSRLSPHLCFGEVSVRQVWHAATQAGVPAASASGREALLRQLYWRDFSSYLLFHFPDLPDKPLRNEYEYFPWREDGEQLRAWQRGMTGFPVVDAGMRQLRETGWMHNRVRMIVASFLVKDLLIPWQTGADWFLDQLVDADLANNSASWQWVAGCGTDAAPYFRVFNPTLQGKKFDPQGSYVRRWVPEAEGPGYPPPLVDHGEARRRALEAYDSIKGMRTSKQAP